METGNDSADEERDGQSTTVGLHPRLGSISTILLHYERRKLTNTMPPSRTTVYGIKVPHMPYVALFITV